ncbi:hypothetical protein HDU91_001985 [Kappamyces sp. JEL0680]|nr:hypothetical protein HDU91_001985 [Kappamyces sp. JEL0680]
MPSAVLSRELYRIQTKPSYDYTRGQIILAPAWNQVRAADPKTIYYPDFVPHESKTRGVELLRESGLLDLDLAFTIRCTRQKLAPVPASSSRERILNTLKRRFAIARMPKQPYTTFVINDMNLELVLLCATYYQSPWNMKQDPYRTPDIKSTAKSCLKLANLEIGDEWYALLRKSQPNSSLRNSLIDVLINPPCHLPISRSERLSEDYSPIVYPTFQDMSWHVKQLKKIDGVLCDAPSSLSSSEFAVCFEYPGLLKRDPFSKVSFKWSVESLDYFPDDCLPELPRKSTQETLLKIDSVKNQNVFIVPFSHQLHPETNDIASMVGQADELNSLFIQPIGFADPVWQLEPELRSASPRATSPRLSDFINQPVEDMDLCSGDYLSPVSSIIDFVGEKASTLLGGFHLGIRVIGLIASLGRGIGL